MKKNKIQILIESLQLFRGQDLWILYRPFAGHTWRTWKGSSVPSDKAVLLKMQKCGNMNLNKESEVKRRGLNEQTATELTRPESQEPCLAASLSSCVAKLVHDHQIVNPVESRESSKTQLKYINYLRFSLPGSRSNYGLNKESSFASYGLNRFRFICFIYVKICFYSLKIVLCSAHSL